MKILSFLIVTSFLAVVAIINYEQSLHPYALLVDEISDLRIIKEILNSKGFESLFKYLFFSIPEFYHGFITLLLPAVWGSIFYWFGGETFLIFSFKMLSALLLVASYLLYAHTFLKKSVFKLLGLAIFLTLPFTNMFSIWPRCEAYLFFFTACFLYFLKKENFRVSWPFFIAGLAFISRISIALYLPVIFLYCLSRMKGAGEKVDYTIKTSIWFTLGVLVAQPQFLFPYNIFSFLHEKYIQMFLDTGNKDYVNFDYWLGDKGLLSFAQPGWTLLLLPLIVLIYYLLKKVLNKENIPFGIVLVIPALISLFNIMFFIKLENAGYYLQHHVVFLILSLLIFCEKKIRSRLLVGCLSLFLVGLVLQRVPWERISQNRFLIALENNRQPYRLTEEWGKTSSPFFQNKLKQRVAILRTLEKEGKRFQLTQGRKLMVRIMADQFQINSSPHYSVLTHWWPAPFYAFEGMPYYDAVIFNYHKYAPAFLKVQKNDGENDIKKNGLEQYLKLVDKKFGGKCVGKSCFNGVKIRGGLYLFLREPTYQSIGAIQQLK